MDTQVRPGAFLVFLLVLAVSPNTEAGSCRAVGCSKSGGNGLFQYQTGHTYVYNFDGNSLTSLPEQHGDAVKLELKAVAEVHFGTDCSNTLKIRDVQVTGPTAKKYSNLKELESHAVRFSFHDGQVEPELCADGADSNTALNIKRAVISLLQVSTPQSSGSASKHEIDVFGNCPTSFVISKSGAETTVTKSRNLNKCSHREDLRQNVLSTPFVSNSELQSSPLLDSSFTAELSIKDGILKTAESHESYLYRPFSNKDAGAKTVVITKLTFVSHGASAAHGVSADSAKSLIFDAPHGDEVIKSNSAVIISALKKAKESMPDQVGPNAATEFRHLVEVFRHSGKDDLLGVYGEVNAGAGFSDKVSARKVFLDALFRTSTGDSIQAAIVLLQTKEISGDLARLWYTSFSFVRHATLETLAAAGALLDSPDAPREAYLGVGSLAGRYCHEHDCHGVKQVDDLLTKLSKPLAGGCHCTTHDQENKIIAALKGIENARGVNEVTAELLRVCASDVSVPVRVRVAALDTFRSDSCQPQLKKTALELLKNTQEDSEIRIKAYLSAVDCPCAKCANTLKELLDNEPVNQVGSFIVSHLRTIRSSANPDKALAKYHLSQVRSSKRFPEDFRRYSHNNEFSYFLDSLNLGSSVERTVIFSQQSYLPRSATLNITTEIFGHSFNLLEIGTRAQNLDRVVESYFGPKGYLKSHDVNEVLKDGKATFKGLKDHLEERIHKTLRSKRSIATDKLEAFRKTIALANDRKNIDLDLNVKLFGSNVGHVSYHGDAHELSPERIIDKLFDCLDKKIEKAKSFNFDIKKHGVFLESELAYPTGLGFPLKLALAGSAAVHLKLEGKIDIHAILKDPTNAHISFEVIPSSAVELVGLLSIDAHAVEAGIKASATLHTASGVNVDIKSVEGTGLDVVVGLPVKKQELINLKSEIYASVQERGQAPTETELAINTKRKDYHDCFDQFVPIIGLTFCGAVAVPFDGVDSKAALFPLNGGAKLSLTVESEDVTTYKFRGAVSAKDPDHRSLQLLIDTPNSKANRKLEFLLEASRKPNREIRAKLISPYKQASAELVLVSDGNERSLSGKLVNDGDEYVVKVGAQVSGAENHRTFTPLFEYSTPNLKSGKKGKKGKSEFNVEGSIVVDKDGDNKKWTFNNVQVSLPSGKVSLNGWVALDKTSISSDLKALHNSADSIEVKGKLERANPTHYKVEADVQASAYPDLGFLIKWEYNREKDQLITDLVLVHGKDKSNTESRITAHADAKYKWVDKKDFDFSGKGAVKYPLLGIDAHIKGAAIPKSVSYDLEGIYNQHSIKSELSAKVNSKADGDYTISFLAKVLDNTVKLESSRDILSPSENKFHNSIELLPGGKYELNADTVCVHEHHNHVHKIVAEAIIAGQPEPFKLDAGVVANPEVFEAHTKANVGSTDYVDLSIKLNKGASPSGSFKALIKDRVDGAGQFKYQNGEGTLAATIDLKKLDRKIKASGDVSVAGSLRKANFDLFFDYDKDQSKKIHFSTDSDVKSQAIDSKNILVVFEAKTVLNINGELTGKPTDGVVVAAVSLVLPSTRYVNLKVNRALHVRPGNTEFDVKYELVTAPAESSPPRSLKVTAKGDNIDYSKSVFDNSLDVLYTTPAGKDVNYHVLAKSIRDGEHHNIEFKGLVKGSLLELAPLLHVKADIVDKHSVSYDIKLNIAPDSNLELVGKGQKGEDGKTPYTVENVLELNLPTGELKNIKLIENWSYKRGQDGAPCHLTGSFSSIYNKENTVKIEVELTGSKEAGNGKVIFSLPKDEPRTIEGSFKVDKSEGKAREGSLTYTHGDKVTHIDGKVVIPESKDSIDVTINAKTPLEKLKTVQITYHGSRNEKFVASETVVIANDKKAVITTKYSLNPKSPVLELTVVSPKGKSHLGFSFHRKESASEEFEGELSLEHGGNSLSAKIDAQVPSVHDFVIILDLNSEKLKWNQLHIIVANKPSKGGKSVTVTATEAGVSIVDGKLTYHFEDGSNGVLYEANGNLKVRGENQVAKISLKKNVIASENENGVEVSYIGVLGDRSAEAGYKRTNKEVHVVSKVCKAKGVCGDLEYQVKWTLDGTDFHREANSHIDLTGLGLATDVGIKSLTDKKAKHFIQTTELHSKNKDVYKYEIEVSDKAASIVLTTPSRQVATEAKYQLTIDPNNKQHITYKYEANAWLNKIKEPAIKSTFSVESDYIRDAESIKITSEAKFHHPSLSKDLIVKSKSNIGGSSLFGSTIEIDIFAKKGQKIVIDAKIIKSEIANGYNITSVLDLKSKGQGHEYVSESYIAISTSVVGLGSQLVYKDDKQVEKDLGFGVQATQDALFIFVKSPKEVLVNIHGSYKLKTDLPSINAEIELIGIKPVIAEAHVEKDHKLIYTIYKKGTPERKIQGVHFIDVTSKAVSHAEWVQGSDKKELYNVVLTWGEQTKPVVSYSLENIKALIEYIRGDLAGSAEQIKLASDSLATGATAEFNEIVDGLKKAQPNLKPVLTSYQTQIKAIRSEIESDQTVQELTDIVKNLIGTASESVAHVTELVAKVAEKALELFEKLSEALLVSLKRIVPVVSQSLNKIFQAVVDISNIVLNQILVSLQRVIEIIKKHEAEVQQVVTVVGELARDAARVVGKAVDQACKEIRDFLGVLVDQLKALPMYGMIQERIEELKQQLKEYSPPDQIFETLHEITSGLKDSLPTEELRDLLKTLSIYIEKHLKKEKVDELAEIRNIYQKLIAAIKSVIVLIKEEIGAKDSTDVGRISWPLSIRALTRIPFLASVHLSPLEYFRSDDLPTLKDLWFTYKPTLNPLSWIPPYKSYGILVDTSHFFTFDKRHYTFKGTCSYLLAQDAVNGNFSIVLNLEGGKYKSVQLSDGKNTIEVLAGQTLLFNGKQHEYPLTTEETNVWRGYHTINLKTKSGVWIRLDNEHHFTVFYISGYYHGQIRGLLGDSNNEQYDDFRLPSGKVSEDVAEFGNAYNIGPTCAPGTADSHAHHGAHSEECSALFSANSPLRAGFNRVDPTPFKEACDHFLTETTTKKQEYACRIASAYVAAVDVNEWNINKILNKEVHVPSVCAECKAISKTIPYGDTVSVKSSGAADVVIVVEQVLGNAELYKELITPLVASLTSDLKSKGINDVEFALIGYGHPDQKWPVHYTTAGKISYDGKLPLEFGDAKKVSTEPTSREERWQLIRHKVNVELGILKVKDAVVEASKYPFRAGASKAVLLVTATHCEKSPLAIGFQKIRLVLAQKEARDRGISFNIISSLDGFTIAGSKDAKTVKSVVGFDKHAVYSLSDAKKKVLEGNEDLRHDIEYTQDVCVDFAQNTHGSVFNAANFLEGKPNSRKNFLQVVSHRLTDSLTEEFTEDCKCTLSQGIYAETRCKVTSRKESEALVAGKGKKGSKH